jgi:hypothetical protein
VLIGLFRQKRVLCFNLLDPQSYGSGYRLRSLDKVRQVGMVHDESSEYESVIGEHKENGPAFWLEKGTTTCSQRTETVDFQFKDV